MDPSRLTRALLINAAILQRIADGRRVSFVSPESTTFTLTAPDGESLGSWSIRDALDLAEAALEQDTETGS